MSRLDGLGNAQLLADLKKLVKRDRVLEAELIAHLGEVEARRLHLEQGCSSMFDYCVRELRFSESVAYKRIGVARVARKFPSLAEAIARGELHLSAAGLIAPHLSEETVEGWLEDARHKKSREVRQLIVDRFPREAIRSSVRRVASVTRSTGPEGMAATGGAASPSSVLRTAGSASSGSSKRSTGSVSVNSEARQPGATTILASVETNTKTNTTARTEPLGARRFSIRFTADEKVHDQLQELRSLLRHSVADGDVGEILARAIGALLKQVRNAKIGECASPRSSQSMRSSITKSPRKKPARHIPVAIRREVWARDEGRCTFQSENGLSCESRDAIEFHHRIPWALCSEHTVDNIALRCRPHNQHEAELDFGTAHMARFGRDVTAENYRHASDPRPDADSRASSRPNRQLDSNPVGSMMLCAENLGDKNCSRVAEESLTLD